jgi:hypothetical protein
VRWLVIVVVVYTALTMLKSGLTATEEHTPLKNTENTE